MPKGTVNVKLTRPDLVGGSSLETEDTVEVYPFQKRHMVESGSVNGGVEDIASPAEKEAGALNVLKKASDRDDIDPWSVQRAYEEGYGFGPAEEGQKKGK